jgi:putative nucleotidyltransferase with HDIG domain
VGAALLPAGVVAIVGVSQVRAALIAQGTQALQQDTRSASLVVLQQLAGLATPGDLQSRRSMGRVRLELADNTGESNTTGSVVRAVVLDDTAAPVTLDTREIWATIDEMFSSELRGLCVAEVGTWRVLHCSPGLDQVQRDRLLAVARAGSGAGDATSREGWLHVSRDIYLRAQYDTDAWRLVMATTEDALLAPVDQSIRTLLALLAIGLIAAFALSHAQIRHRTQPLEALQAGTRRVRDGHYDTQVQVHSRDEYRELADAFNGMTAAIGRQFTLFGHLDALDDVALRTPRTDAIVDVALARFHQAIDASVVSLATLADEHDDTLTITWRVRDPRVAPSRVRRTLRAADRALLTGTPRLVTDSPTLARSSFIDLNAPTWRDALPCEAIVLPLMHDRVLLGVVVIGMRTGSRTDETQRAEVRRLADRLVLGLANVRLLERLEAQAIGTLRAFASAIDANSRWTAGHSERVTTVAVALGHELGCDAADLERLRRGCLLHDIGKIGVPASILDKAGALTREELAIMQQHPVIGEQILSAVPAFREILPIVRSHHERMDGRGYPDGLAGAAIDRLARIAAVADAFDALVSDRPYRAGLSAAAAVQRISAESGTHFDPDVVAALTALEQHGRLARMDDELFPTASPHGDPVAATPLLTMADR